MQRCKRKTIVVLLVPLITLGTSVSVWAGMEIGLPKAPAGVSTDWWTQAQAHIRQAEYRPSPATTDNSDRSVTVQAPNRAHNFRTFFSPEGIRVVPRTATSPNWSWKLTLEAVGAHGDLRRPEPAHVRLNGQRVELVRGTLTEWYINDQRGGEQGFTLREPPPGSEEADELVLRLAVHGTLVGSLDHDGTTLAFAARDGKPMLHFGHLLAIDATGRKLPARFSLDDGDLEITVATTAAQYPLLIDPLATSANWTDESNQAGAWFGSSVASAGDVNSDGYDDVIIGVPNFDVGEADEGVAIVYLGSATGLSSTPIWGFRSEQMGCHFGGAVATAGDVNGDGYADVVVGAYLFDNGQNNEGKAFVFHGSASGLSPTPNWTAESNQTDARFGWSVSTAGDVNGDGYADVIVGAPDYDNGHAEEGRAFVYHGSATGLNAVANRTAESNQADANFGYSVSTAGDVNMDGFGDVIIGAYNYSNGQTYEGAAYGFYGSAFGLGGSPNWITESGQAYAHLGVSVSTAGDVNSDGYTDVIIGAYGYNNRGAAIVFPGSGSGLQINSWVAYSDQEDAQFGSVVSTAGDVNGDGYADVIVGADLYDNGESDEGRLFVYHGSAAGLLMPAVPNWTAESDQANAHFGHSVATAGDVNGDGADDIIVGAFTFDNGEADEGRAFVFHGSAGSFYVIPTLLSKPAIIYLE